MNDNKSFNDLSNEKAKQLFQISNDMQERQHLVLSNIQDSKNDTQNKIEIKRKVNNRIKTKIADGLENNSPSPNTITGKEAYNVKMYKYDLQKSNLESGTIVNAWDINNGFITRELLSGDRGRYTSSMLTSKTIEKINIATRVTPEEELDIELKVAEFNKELQEEEKSLIEEESKLKKALEDSSSIEYKEIKDKIISEKENKIRNINEKIKGLETKINNMDKSLLTEKAKLTKQEEISKNNIAELERKKTYANDPKKIELLDKQIKAEKEKINKLRNKYLKSKTEQEVHRRTKEKLEKDIKDIQVKYKTDENINSNIKENITNKLNEIDVKKKNLNSFNDEKLKQNFANDINNISTETVNKINSIDFKFKTFNNKEDFEKALEQIPNEDARNIVRNLYSFNKETGIYEKQNYFLWHDNKVLDKKGITEIVGGDVSKINKNFKPVNIDAIKEEFYRNREKMQDELLEYQKMNNILNKFEIQNKENSHAILESTRKYLLNDESVSEELSNRILSNKGKFDKVSAEEYIAAIKGMLKHPVIANNVSLDEVNNAIKDLDTISNTLELLKSNDRREVLKGMNSIKESWADRTSIGTNKIKAAMIRNNEKPTTKNLLENHSIDQIIDYVNIAKEKTEEAVIQSINSVKFDINKQMKQINNELYTPAFTDIEDEKSLNVEEDMIISSEFDRGTTHKRDSNNKEYIEELNRERDNNLYEESNKVNKEIEDNTKKSLLQQEFLSENSDSIISSVRNRVVEINNANIKENGKAVRIKDLERNLTLEELEKGYVDINGKMLPIQHTKQYNQLMSISDLRDQRLPFTNEEWLNKKVKIGDNDFSISHFKEYYDNDTRIKQNEESLKFINNKYDNIIKNKQNAVEEMNNRFNKRLQNMIPNLKRTVKQTKRKRLYDEEKGRMVYKNYTVDREVPLFSHNYPTVSQSKITEKMFKSIESVDPTQMVLTGKNGEKQVVTATIGNIESLAKEYGVSLPKEVKDLIQQHKDTMEEMKIIPTENIEEKVKQVNATHNTSYSLQPNELTNDDMLEFNKYESNKKYSPILYTENEINPKTTDIINQVKRTPNKKALKFKNDSVSYDVVSTDNDVLTTKPSAWINAKDLKVDFNIDDTSQLKNLNKVDTIKNGLNNSTESFNKNIKPVKIINDIEYDSNTLFNEFLSKRYYNKKDLNALTTMINGKETPIGLNLQESIHFNSLGLNVISTSFPWMIDDEKSLQSLAGTSEIAVREAFAEASSGEINKSLMNHNITDIFTNPVDTSKAFEEAISEKVKVKILKQYMTDANKNNEFFLVDIAKKAIIDNNQDFTTENVQNFLNSIVPYVKQDASLNKRFKNLSKIANNKRDVEDLLRAYKNSDIKSFDKIFDSVEEGLENNLGIEKLRTLTDIHGKVNSNAEKDLGKFQGLINNIKINKHRERVLKQIGTNDNKFTNDVINSVARKYVNKNVSTKGLTPEEAKLLKKTEFLKAKKNIIKNKVPLSDMYGSVSERFLEGKEEEVSKILGLINADVNKFNQMDLPSKVEFLHNILRQETKKGAAKISTLSTIRDIAKHDETYMSGPSQKFFKNNQGNIMDLISQYVNDKGGITEIASPNEIQKILKNANVEDYEAFKDLTLMSNILGIDAKFYGTDSNGNKVEFNVSDIKDGYNSAPGNIVTNRFNNENIPVANNINELTRVQPIKNIKPENIHVQNKNNIESYKSDVKLFQNKIDKVTNVLASFPENYDRVAQLPGNSIGTMNPTDTLINTESFVQDALNDKVQGVTIDYETTGLKDEIDSKLFAPVELSVQHIEGTNVDGKVAITPTETKSIYLAPNGDINNHMTQLLDKNENNINNLIKEIDTNSVDINFLKNYAKYDYADATLKTKVEDGVVFFNKNNTWEHSNMSPEQYINKLQESAGNVIEFLNNPTIESPIAKTINPNNVHTNIASFMNAAQNEIKKNNPQGYVIAHNFSGAEKPWTEDFTNKAIEFIDNNGKKKYKQMTENIQNNGIIKPIDTMQLVKTVEPGRRKVSLDFLAADKNIKTEGTSHLANVDVTNTTSLLQDLVNNPQYKNVSEAVKEPLKKGDIIFKKRHDSNSISLEKGVYKIGDIEQNKNKNIVLTLDQLSSDNKVAKTVQVEVPNIATLQREMNKNISVVKDATKALELNDKMIYMDSMRTMNTAIHNYDILNLYKTRALEGGNDGIKQRLKTMKHHYDEAVRKTSYVPKISENGVKEFSNEQLTSMEKIALGNAHILSDKGYSKELLILNKNNTSRRMAEMNHISNYMNTNEGKLLDKFLFEGYVRKESNLISNAQFRDYASQLQNVLHTMKKNNGTMVSIPNNYNVMTINSNNIEMVAEATDKLGKIKPMQFNIDMTSKNSISNSIWETATKLGKEMQKNNVVKSLEEGKTLAMNKHVLPLLQQQGIIPKGGQWSNIENKAINLSSKPIPNIPIDTQFENMLPSVSSYIFENKENLIKENKIKPLQIVDTLKPVNDEVLPTITTHFNDILGKLDKNITKSEISNAQVQGFDSTVQHIINSSRQAIINTKKQIGEIPFAKYDFETQNNIQSKIMKEFNIQDPVNEHLAFKSADEIINMADKLPKDKDIVSPSKFIKMYNNLDTRDLAKQAMPEYVQALKQPNGKEIDYISDMNNGVKENLNAIESQLKTIYSDNAKVKMDAYKELRNRANRKTSYDHDVNMLEKHDPTVFNARRNLGLIQEGNNGEYFTASIAAPSEIEAIKNRTKLDPSKIKITSGVNIEHHDIGDITGYSLTDFTIPQLKEIANHKFTSNFDKENINKYLSIPNIENIHTDEFAINNFHVSKNNKASMQYNADIKNLSTIVEKTSDKMDNTIVDEFNKDVTNRAKNMTGAETSINHINPAKSRIEAPLGTNKQTIEKKVDDIIQKNVKNNVDKALETDIEKSVISDNIGKASTAIKDAGKAIKDVTSTIVNSSAVKFGMLGLAFAGTAFLLNRRTSDGGRLEQRPQKDSAPNSNGEYDNKEYNGQPHEKILKPTKNTRVEANGSGMTINISGKNRGAANDKQIQDSITNTLNNSVNANINIHQRDDRQCINSNFISDLISKALK